MIPSQLIQVPFSGGLNQKNAEKYLEPGAEQKVAQNVLFLKNGTIQKRLGFKPINRTVLGKGAMAKGVKALAYKNELAVIDGQYLNTWSPNANSLGSPTGEWARRDQVSPCVATRLSIAQSTQTFGDADMSEGFGFRVYVWTATASGSTGAIYASVMDTDTGAFVMSSVANGTATPLAHPRVVIVNQQAIILAQDAANTIYSAVIDLHFPNVWSGTFTSLRTDLVTGGAWDAVPVVGASPGSAVAWVLAYEHTGASPKIVAFGYDSTITQNASGSLSGESHSGFSTLNIRATAGETLWIAYGFINAGVGTVMVGGLNPSTLAQTIAPITVRASGAVGTIYAGIERIDSTHVGVVWAYASGTTGFWSARVSSGGSVDRGPRQQIAAIATSRPFTVNGRTYVYGVGIYQSTQFLYDLMMDVDGATIQCFPAATVAPRFSSTGNSRSFNSLSTVSNVGVANATQFRTIGTSVLGAGVTGRTGVVEVTFDFAHPGLFVAAELGESLYLAGGVPCLYDGSQVVEAGFLWFPSGASLSSTATVGGGLHGGAGSIYQYVFVYEWTDARGQRHQSAPSLPLTVDLTASGTNTNTATLSIPTIMLTMRQEFDLPQNVPIGIVPYRTAFLNGAMGTVFYRVVPDVIPVSLANAESSQFVTWTDAVSDLAISLNPLVYTTGGVVESDCPSSFTTLCAHKNRIWGVGDDQRTVWFSTDYVQGEPVRFNDLFTFTVEDGGPITALAGMDDALVIFKRDRIFVVSGDGPPQTGAGSDLSVPRRIASDVGCIDPRSVVLTPMGLMFQSPSGIYLLTRALEAEWLGRPVIDELVLYPQVTSATMLGDQGLILFTASSGGSQGEIIAYDYVNNAWSTWTVNDSADFSSSTSPWASAANVNGSLYLLTPLGAIVQQNTVDSPLPYLDGESWVTLAVWSAWFKPSGLQGFARIRRVQVLCEIADAFDLKITLLPDYSTQPGDAQVARFTPASMALATTDRAQFDVHVTRQKVEALQVQINDAPDGASSGVGPTLIGILLEVAVKQGRYKNLPTIQKG